MGEVVSLTHNEAWELVAAARQLILDDGKQANICVVNRHMCPVACNYPLELPKQHLLIRQERF